MIIRSGYIFVHIPKTGGMSVSRALAGRKDSNVSTHTPLWMLRDNVRGNKPVFTFVRNPWSRMASLYRFLCQKTFMRTDNYDKQKVIKAGFKAWLMEHEFFMMEDDRPVGEPWIMPGFRKLDDPSLYPPMQRRPQCWWLGDATNVIIGRTENLEEDFTTITRKLNIKYPHLLKRINATKGSDDWKRIYCPASWDFVAEHFAPDIERFGYAA